MSKIKLLPDSIMKEILEKSGASEEEINEVFKSVVMFVLKTMRRGLFEGVRVMGLGTFKVSEARINLLKKRVISQAFDDVENDRPGDKL